MTELAVRVAAAATLIWLGMVTVEPVPVEHETLAGQAIAECPRAALSRKD